MNVSGAWSPAPRIRSRASSSSCCFAGASTDAVGKVQFLTPSSSSCQIRGGCSLDHTAQEFDECHSTRRRVVLMAAYAWERSFRFDAVRRGLRVLMSRSAR